MVTPTMSRLLSSNLPQFSSNHYVSHVNYSKKPHKNSFMVRLDRLILCIALFCQTKSPNGLSILFSVDAVTDQIELVNIFFNLYYLTENF